MGDTMDFPDNIINFFKSYSFKDNEEIYTNGSELISIYRVIQALEHYAPELLSNIDIQQITM